MTCNAAKLQGQWLNQREIDTLGGSNGKCSARLQSTSRALFIQAPAFPLSRQRDALETRRRIKIIAIGSSSTAGESNIIPFPHRLELALRSFYPGRMIDVVNRGIGGQEAPEELARFESDVTIEAPTLVIWQVGTNAIYHRELYDPPSVARIVETGVSWLKNLQADVILM